MHEVKLIQDAGQIRSEFGKLTRSEPGLELFSKITNDLIGMDDPGHVSLGIDDRAGIEIVFVEKLGYFRLVHVRRTGKHPRFGEYFEAAFGEG